ncbi:MAG: hypothetical protein KatS3mg049_3245 [Caldilinea sp.]|jgi:hypothetical protein|nr:MAG: hypothetical protein KatS3mg049_3245 [Caldilinea sp.]
MLLHIINVGVTVFIRIMSVGIMPIRIMPVSKVYVRKREGEKGSHANLRILLF